jgi:hypothetical protein
MRGSAVKAAERSEGELPRELKTRRVSAFKVGLHLLGR